MNIPSQLSPTDAHMLRAVMQLVSDSARYSYLEIGSYLGGSLHFHLTNPKCDLAISVDKRSTDPILDERCIDYAYTVRTQDMLDLFKENNIPTSRLTTIDGTVEHVPAQHIDLIFIDGEHTNTAVLSDATECLKFTPNIILFHDDWIVYHGLDLFIQRLTDSSIQADVYKLANCDITAIVFGDAQAEFAKFAKPQTINWHEFRTQASQRLTQGTQQ